MDEGLQEDDYLCIGVCLPDEDGAWCIGCGRPWGQRSDDDLRLPPAADDGDDGEAA